METNFPKQWAQLSIGFRELRLTQREAISPILDGLDVLILSPTGSGKTEAVVAPLVRKMASRNALRCGLHCLVYHSPPRALANDLQTPRAVSQQVGCIGRHHGTVSRNDLSLVRKPDIQSPLNPVGRHHSCAGHAWARCGQLC